MPPDLPEELKITSKQAKNLSRQVLEAYRARDIELNGKQKLDGVLK